MDDTRTFMSTLWPLVERAGRGETAALEDLCRRYRAPVVRHFQRKGYRAEDAEDLAQTVFVKVVSGRVLEKADPSRGRFRAFLLAVARNVAREFERGRHAEKRGGGQAPLGEHDLDAPLDDLLPAPADEDFDREWLGHLVTSAIEDLRVTRPQHAGVLDLVVEGVDSRAEMARRLGQDETWVRNTLYHARKGLLDAVRRRIAGYCRSVEELEEELAALGRYLPSSRT